MGTLFRSSYQYSAAFIATVGNVSPGRQSTDTTAAWAHISLLSFSRRRNAKHLCALQLSLGRRYFRGFSIKDFEHPKRAMYVLEAVLLRCRRALSIDLQYHVSLPSQGGSQLVTAPITGSIALFDRLKKMKMKKGNAKEMQGEKEKRNRRKGKRMDGIKRGERSEERRRRRHIIFDVRAHL